MQYVQHNYKPTQNRNTKQTNMATVFIGQNKKKQTNKQTNKQVELNSCIIPTRRLTARIVT